MIAVRDARANDGEAVRATITASFGRSDEADLVSRLLTEAVVVASLVACDDTGVIGYVLFSEVRIEGDRPGTLASLAPLAVHPAAQRRGIGAALVTTGLDACSRFGSGGVIVVGHPAYYQRFGFSATAVAHLASPYAGPAFMGLDLMPGAISRLRGTIVYPAAYETVTPRAKL